MCDRRQKSRDQHVNNGQPINVTSSSTTQQVDLQLSVQKLATRHLANEQQTTLLPSVSVDTAPSSDQRDNDSVPATTESSHFFGNRLPVSVAVNHHQKRREKMMKKNDQQRRPAAAATASSSAAGDTETVLDGSRCLSLDTSTVYATNQLLE